MFISHTFFTPYRLGADEIEIGLGIHGEPGTTKTPSMPADALVQRMLSQIVASKHFGGPLAQVSGERLWGKQIARCMLSYERRDEGIVGPRDVR